MPKFTEPHPNPQAQLNQGIQTADFTLRQDGSLHPTRALLESSAREMGIVTPPKAWGTVLAGGLFSAVVGAFPYGELLLYFDENLGEWAYAVGAAISVGVLGGMTKALIPVHESHFSHADLRHEYRLGWAMAAGLWLCEAAFVAWGLSVEHVGLLGGAGRAWVPLLGGGLISALNLATGNYLARVLTRNKLVFQRAMVRLYEGSLRPQVDEAMDLLWKLRLDAELWQIEHALPTVEKSTDSKAGKGR